MPGLGNEKAKKNVTKAIAEEPNRQTVDAYTHVGRTLRRLRQTRGLTQAQAAKVIEVSPQQYQKYEEAHSKCSLNYLIMLADFYDVDVNVFLPSNAGTSEDVVDEQPDDMAVEADLLARLVSTFVKLDDAGEKLRLVQLVEAIASANAKRHARVVQ